MATDVGINGVCCGVALLLCEDGLLFQKRREEFVGVLDGAEGQDTRRINFVQDGNFAVETGVARKGILFEVSDLGLNVSLKAANATSNTPPALVRYRKPAGEIEFSRAPSHQLDVV